MNAAARASQVAETIVLGVDQAEVIAAEVRRSCDFMRWRLGAFAVMATHLHVVLTVSGDPDPDTIVRDLKAYTSRALNRSFAKPVRGWWTRGASKRVLKSEDVISAAIRYVRDQRGALAAYLDRELSR